MSPALFSLSLINGEPFSTEVVERHVLPAAEVATLFLPKFPIFIVLSQCIEKNVEIGLRVPLFWAEELLSLRKVLIDGSNPFPFRLV